MDAPFPYKRKNEFLIDGLPDVPFRKPSGYGVSQLKKIIESRDCIKIRIKELPTSAEDIAETFSVPVTSSSLVPSRSALYPDLLVLSDDFLSPPTPTCRSLNVSAANVFSPSTSSRTTAFSPRQSNTSASTAAVSSSFTSDCTSYSSARSSVMSTAEGESSAYPISIPFTSTTGSTAMATVSLSSSSLFTDHLDSAISSVSCASSLSTAPFSSLHGLLSRSSVAPLPSTVGLSCNSPPSAVSTCFPVSNVRPSSAAANTMPSSEPTPSELHPCPSGQTFCSSSVSSSTTIAFVPSNAPSLNSGPRKRKLKRLGTKQRELPGMYNGVFLYIY